MAIDHKAHAHRLIHAWRDADLRSRMMLVLGCAAIFCFLMALITRDPTGGPGHLLPVHRPALPTESVRIEAGGPHEMPTGWSISYGIFGVSQTPGEAEVWVDGHQLTLLKWTDYQARRKVFCVSPVAGERMPYLLEKVAPGSIVTVVPRDLGGDWYVDVEMFPTVDDCAGARNTYPSWPPESVGPQASVPVTAPATAPNSQSRVLKTEPHPV